MYWGRGDDVMGIRAIFNVENNNLIIVSKS